MFLLCKRGRKSDRWFSCRMACVCWSGLLAGQTHSGCFLFLSVLPASLLYPSISVWLCVRAWIRDVYTNTNQPLTIQAFPKTANKRDLKRIGTAPKTKKIKRRPEPPQTIQVPVSFSSSIQRFDFIFVTREETKKEGSRGTGTSCRRVPGQYPAGCASYLGGESKFVLRR